MEATVGDYSRFLAEMQRDCSIACFLKLSLISTVFCPVFIADARVRPTESPLTYLRRINTTYISDLNATQNPPGDSPMGFFNSSEASMTTALSNTSSVTFNSSRAPHWTHFEPHTSRSSTVELPLPTSTCCKKCLIFILRLHSIPNSWFTSQSSSACVRIEK